MSDNLPERSPELPRRQGDESPPPTPAQYASADTDEGAGSLRELLRVLGRHTWMLVLLPLLTTSAAWYLATRELPVFRSNAVFRIADERGAMMAGVVGGVNLRRDPVPTQLAVLQSREILGQVTDQHGLRLHLGVPANHGGLLRDVEVRLPENTAERLQLRFGAERVIATLAGRQSSAAYGQPVELDGLRFTVRERPEVAELAVAVLPRDEASDNVRSNLTVWQRRDTDLVEAQYSSYDPTLAREVVNSVVEVFRSENLRRAQQQATRRREFLEQQIRNTDSMLIGASAALISTRGQRETLSAANQLGARQSAIQQLDTRREDLLIERRMFRSLAEQLQAAPSGERSRVIRTLTASPVVASNPAVMHWYSQLQQHEVQRRAATTGEWSRSPTHPDVARLDLLVSEAEAQLLDAVAGHLEFLEARLAQLNEQRAQAASQLQTLPDATMEEWRLEQDVNRLNSLLERLRAEHQQASISEALEVGQVEVISLARGASRQGGRPLQQVLIGLVLGLMLGSGGAFVLESLNTSIRRREELESALRIPFLGVIPSLQGGGRRVWRLGPLSFERRARLEAGGNGNGHGSGALASGRRVSAPSSVLVALHNARSNGAEAYRTLRTNLIFSQAAQSLRTVIVTSPSKGEGKTTTATNLAVTFAQQGLRVVIVDADLRRPRIASVFGVPREPGLTNLLLEATVREASICPTSIEGLFVMPAGTVPPNPAELLGGSRMLRLIHALREHYDMVILDTPPVLVASDAAILASRVDGVLMVVRAGQTDRASAQHAMQQITSVQGRMVGAVLNDPDSKVVGYGGYYHYYQHEYYGEETATA